MRSQVEVAGLAKRNAELEAEIARHEAAEAALRESEARLRLVVTSSPDAIFYLDRDLRCTWVTHPGPPFTEERVLGKTLFELFEPEDARRAAEVCRQALATGVGAKAELRLRIGGVECWFEVAIRARRDESERIAGLAVYCHEVTEHKRAEEALQRSEATLAQAGYMAHLGAWEIEVSNPDDLNANPLRWSEEVYRIFGYEPGSVAVSNELFFERVHPEDRQRVRDAVAHAIATRQPYSIEHRIVRPDGTERIAFEHADVVFDERGRLVRVVGAVQDITERKRAEEERERLLAQLVDERARWKATVDVIVDPVIVCDAEGYLAFANSAARRLLGRRVAPDLPASEHPAYYGLYCPDGTQLRVGDLPLQRAARLGEALREIEVLHRTAGGQERTLVWSAAPLRDVAGRLAGAVAVGRDVTEHKRAEDALRESEERFRSTFDQAPIGAAIVALDFRFLRVNEEMCRITGYSAEELASRGFPAITHPDDLEADVRQARLLAAGEIDQYQMEKRYIRKDGGVVWVRLSVQMVRDAASRPLYYLPMIEDITERKRAEEDRAEALAREQTARTEAQRQAAQLTALLHNLAEGVIVVDRAGRIPLLNPYGRRVCRLPEKPEGWTLQDYRQLDVRGLDDKPLPFEEWAISRALRGEQFTDRETVLVQPTGSRRRLVASGSAVRDDTGEVALAIVVFRDVTELRQLEQVKEEYVHTISHDLRNPLAVAMGQSQWLHRLLVKKGQEQEASTTDSILTSLRRMNSMIQDLVESARLESGALEMHKQPTDLGHLVSDIAERVGSLQDRARIRVEIPEWVPLVLADADRIERAIVNLITNALKYSPADAPVVVRVSRGDGQAVISVSDQGVGIPPDEVPHIFDRLYRARTGRKSEGLGLGLYITRMLVEAHGGRVWAESEVGRGSTFSLALPTNAG